MLRQGALNEFEIFRGSAEWRTYFALNATFLSLPDSDLRREVQSALTESEQGLLSRVAASYERVTTLIGLRLRPELGVTFETIAYLANATIRGLVIMAPAAPGVAARPRPGQSLRRSGTRRMVPAGPGHRQHRHDLHRA